MFECSDFGIGLTAGKTLTTRNLVTGQGASVHYGEDGTRTVFFGPHHVIRSPYEIRDGIRIEQTAQGASRRACLARSMRRSMRLL